MKYSVGGVITGKKAHACGGNTWTVVRTGADIKLKCNTCGRCIFVSTEQADKITKTYKEAENKQ
ncbi:MAG: DUF951 domain-containing protein [Clostridia bacterium]|nr:DUF951 domain-containing protein [Clostridia bacterium]